MTQANTQTGGTTTGGTGLSDAAAVAGMVLYNQIILEIEPELTNDQLPLLEEKYRGETEEQAKERAERYQRAFEEYDQKFAAYQKDWNTQLITFKHSALASTEQQSRAEEMRGVADIESQMSASS